MRELEEGNTKICNFHERAKRELEFLQEKIEKAKVEKNYFQQQRDVIFFFINSNFLFVKQKRTKNLF